MLKLCFIYLQINQTNTLALQSRIAVPVYHYINEVKSEKCPQYVSILLALLNVPKLFNNPAIMQPHES